MDFLLEDLFPYLDENNCIEIVSAETGEVLSVYDGRNSISLSVVDSKVVMVRTNKPNTITVEVIPA